MDQSPAPATPSVTPPSSPAPQTERRVDHFSPGRLFFGLLIVFIGFAFLSNSLGWGWFDAVEWWRFWPAFIILWGLSLLGGRSRSGGWIAIGVAFIIIVFIVAASINAAWLPMRSAGPLETHDLAITREADATSAVIRFDLGAADVAVTGGTDQSVSGTYVARGPNLTTSSRLADGVQTVILETPSRRGWQLGDWGKTTLDVKLDTTRPTELRLQGGAFSGDFDLRDLLLTRLDIDAGASSIDLKLGDKVASTKVTVEAGASSVNVSLPKGVGARAKVDAGLSSKSLPDFKKLDDDTYETENYAGAEKKIDLDFDLGVSSLNLTWR